MNNVLPLPSDALERALRRSQPLPVSEGALNRVITRLRKGLSLIVTAVGQSNTFGPGGCFGVGCVGCVGAHTTYAVSASCMDHCAERPCWGTEFMHWLNSTYPHPRHALYNRAMGASNPRTITTCLSSHLAPHTDVLLVDFNLMGWKGEEIERLARTAALMTRPPLVIFIGLVNWCPATSDKTGVGARQNGETEWAACRRGWAEGRFASDDPIGERVAAIAREYKMVSVSMFDAIAPLIARNDSLFGIATNAQGFMKPRFTDDGIHGLWDERTGNRSAYYDAITRVLVHTVRTAIAAHAALPPHTSASSEAARRSDVFLPPLLHPGAGRRIMLQCYEWLSLNLPAPRLVSNSTVGRPRSVGGGSGSPGWRVSEYTLHGKPRRKPGLVTTDVGDQVELAVSLVGGASPPRGVHRAPERSPLRRVCIGLTYLTSYELMGEAEVECVAPCECPRTRVNALDVCTRFSLFRTTEIAASAGASECTLRLTNMRPGANRSTARGHPAPHEWTKLRVLGLYTRLAQPRVAAFSGAGASTSLIPPGPLDCDADVGVKTGDHWWYAAINAQQSPGGVGWSRDLTALRKEQEKQMKQTPKRGRHTHPPSRPAQSPGRCAPGA